MRKKPTVPATPAAPKMKAAGKRSGWTLAFTGMTSAALAWRLLDEMNLVWLPHALRPFQGWLLVATALGALIGITRASRFLHALAALVLALYLAVSYSPLAALVAGPLRVETAPVSADAVVVLAATIQRDNDLADEALSRAVRGIQLVQARHAPRLVLTEMPPPQGSSRAAVQRLLDGLGIRCAIETVGPVVHTRDEAVAVSALARERGWKRILMVTSPTHSRRALATFRKAAPAGLEVVSTPCREGSFDMERIDHAGDRRWAFATAAHEWLGIWMYRVRGWM